jgi:hypothetical protein
MAQALLEQFTFKRGLTARFCPAGGMANWDLGYLPSGRKGVEAQQYPPSLPSHANAPSSQIVI